MSILDHRTWRSSRRAPLLLAGPLLLLLCCGQGAGHAKLGSLGADRSSVSIVFQARGTENHFTLTSSRPIHLPAACNLRVRVYDAGGAEIVSADLGGASLEPTRWDAPLHSRLLAPLPGLEELRSGRSYRIELSVQPPIALRQPLSLVHHWTGPHWE